MLQLGRIVQWSDGGTSSEIWNQTQLKMKIEVLRADSWIADTKWIQKKTVKIERYEDGLIYELMSAVPLGQS